MDLHYEDIRRDYGRRSLSRKDLTDDPFELVRLWLQEAVDDPKVLEPTAVLVCTSTPDGHCQSARQPHLPLARAGATDTCRGYGAAPRAGDQ